MKNLPTCVIFLLALQAIVSAEYSNGLRYTVNPNLSDAEISKILYESRLIGGMDGCITFGVEIHDASLKYDDPNWESHLSVFDKDVVKMVDPILEGLLLVLEDRTFNLRNSVIDYAKECQLKFTWAYMLGNGRYFSEFLEHPKEMKEFTGEELAEMETLNTLIPEGY